jgi:hypothetical protein
MIRVPLTSIRRDIALIRFPKHPLPSAVKIHLPVLACHTEESSRYFSIFRSLLEEAVERFFARGLEMRSGHRHYDATVMVVEEEVTRS